MLLSQRRQRLMEKIREEVQFEANVCAENDINSMLIMLCEIQEKIGIDKLLHRSGESEKDFNVN